MKRKLNLLIMLVLFFLFSFSAKGYSMEIKDVDVDLTAEVSEEYDDNITMVKEEPLSDYTTNIMPGITAKYEDDFKSWNLAVDLKQQIFAKNKKFDKLSQLVSFDFTKELSRFSMFTLRNDFTHAYEPVSFASAFGRTSGRYGYFDNNLSIGYIRELSKQLAMNVSYSHELDQFTRNDLDNSHRNQVVLGCSYDKSSATKLSAEYEFGKRNFHRGGDAGRNLLSLAVNHYLTKQLSLEAKAGVDFIDAYDNSDYTKPLFLVSIYDEVDPATTAGITYIKDYTTNPYLEDIFNRWDVSAFFNRELNKRVSLALTGFYGSGKYIATGIQDQIMGQKAALIYSLQEDFKLDLSYVHSQVNSNDDTHEYDRNQFRIGLKKEF